MRRPLPPKIQRVATATGWKLVFPWRAIPQPLRRKIHHYLLGGSVALLVGVVLLAFSFAAKPPEQRAPLLGLFMMGAVLALYLVAIAVNHIWTRSAVEVTADGVRLIEQQGLFKRVRKRPWIHVRKLVTHHIIHSPDPKDGPRTDTGALEVVGHGAQTLWFAHDYPREWLLAVGEHLAEAGRIVHEVAPWDTKEANLVQAFFQHETADGNTLDVDKPPPNTRCTLEDREGVLTLFSPAPPFWRTVQAKSLATLNLVFLGFAAFTAYAVWSGGMGALNVIIPIGTFFLLAGGIVIISQFDTRLWIRFRVDAENLIIVKRSRLGKEETLSWSRLEVAAIRAEEVNPNDSDSTAMHLKIIFFGRSEFTCLAGREPQELWWIATVLRKALDVPAVAGHSTLVPGRTEQATSRSQ